MNDRVCMQTTKNRKLGALAVSAVALAGVGTAVAASKLHTGSSPARAAGPSGGFSGGGAQQQQQGVPQFGPGGGRGGGRGFDGSGFGGPGGGLSAAASYLGLSQSQLFADLQSGKTLGQVADATSGKSASGLIAAMVAAEQTELASAVQSGRLTQALADRLEANLKTRVTAMVNGTFGPGRHRDGDGFGPPGGSNGGGPAQPGTSPT